MALWPAAPVEPPLVPSSGWPELRKTTFLEGFASSGRSGGTEDDIHDRFCSAGWLEDDLCNRRPTGVVLTSSLLPSPDAKTTFRVDVGQAWGAKTTFRDAYGRP